MELEMNSIRANKTWDLVEIPKNRRALPRKWFYRLKETSDSTNRNYKARSIVKGFRQEYGVDFDEICPRVVKVTTLRFMLGVVATENLELIQLDVKTTFLHGDLKDEIYMEQSKGFVASGQEHLVCRLKKSLYRLKHAPRQWYKKLDNFIRSVGFSKSDENHCLFTKPAQDGSPIFLIIYVDDMLLSGRYTGELTELVRQLRLKFAMKDLGPARYILRMKISRNRYRRQLFLSQTD